MQGLIDAINQSHSKDIIDIIAIFSPLVLSVVAIVISIYTVQKQNKISLFEMRYKAFATLKSIVLFASTVKNVDSNEQILLVFDSFFGTYISNNNGNDLVAGLNSKIEMIKHDTLTSVFLFSKKYQKPIETFVYDFQLFMINVINNYLDEKSKNDFCEKCSLFTQNELDEISKELRI